MTIPVLILGMLTLLFGVWTTPMVEMDEAAASVSALSDIHVHVAYHLDLRHENVMAVASWGLGLLLLFSERMWSPAARGFARVGKRFGPERIYSRTLDGLEYLSDSIHRIEVRDLRSRVATILAPAGLLVGIGRGSHAK